MHLFFWSPLTRNIVSQFTIFGHMLAFSITFVSINDDEDDNNDERTDSKDSLLFAKAIKVSIFKISRDKQRCWYLSDRLSLSKVMVGLFFLMPHRRATCCDWPGTMRNTPSGLFSQRMYWGLYVASSSSARMNFHRCGVFDSNTQCKRWASSTVV